MNMNKYCNISSIKKRIAYSKRIFYSETIDMKHVDAMVNEMYIQRWTLAFHSPILVTTVNVINKMLRCYIRGILGLNDNYIVLFFLKL